MSKKEIQTGSVRDIKDSDPKNLSESMKVLC